MLTPDAAEREHVVRRFENEARIISKLRHPNTLKLFDFGETEDERLFLVAEFLSGQPLDSVLRAGSIGVPRTLHVLAQAADSLAEAHGQGIVHRDLKPGNLFVERVADQDVIKVLDFGIAKLSKGTSYTAEGTVFGTPAYMSPEQARGETVDSRSDLYSLGVIAYECLCGSPPFQADTPVSVLLRHVSDEPISLTRRVPPVAVPPEVDVLVLRLLAKDPDQRPQTAADLKSFPTNSLHVAGITDPSPLPALRRKTGTSKYRHLRRALAAGRLGAPARSGICREALKREIVALARQLPPEELEAGGAAALAADSGPFGSLPSTPASGVQGSLSHADTFPSDEMGILDTEALVQVASGGKRWRLVGLVAAAVALLALAGWLLAGRSAPQDASAASEQPGADSAESVTAETTPRWIRSPPRLPRPRRPRLRSRRLRLPRHPRVRRRVQASRRSGRSARSAHAASPAGRGSSQVPQAEEGIR